MATCPTGYCTVHCVGRCCGCRNGDSGQRGSQVAHHEVSAERPSGPSSSSGANIPGTLPVPPPPPVHHTRTGSRTHRPRANSTVAGHQGIRVCRRVPCRNSIADCCRTAVPVSVVLAMFPSLKPMAPRLSAGAGTVLVLWRMGAPQDFAPFIAAARVVPAGLGLHHLLS